jgi:hypothetical protein
VDIGRVGKGEIDVLRGCVELEYGVFANEDLDVGEVVIGEPVVEKVEIV